MQFIPSHLTRTILAVSTLAAAMSVGAAPTYVHKPQAVDGWELLKKTYDHNPEEEGDLTVDQNAALAVWSGADKDLSLKGEFSNETLDAIRKVEPFGDFGMNRDDEGVDNWSLISGLLIGKTSDRAPHQSNMKSLSIDLSSAEDLEMENSVYLAGLNVTDPVSMKIGSKDGAVDIKLTNKTPTPENTGESGEPDEMGAYGIFFDGLADLGKKPRKVTFEGKTNTVTVKASDIAVGAYAMSGFDSPSITFAGDETTITAESETTAIGAHLEKTDWEDVVLVDGHDANLALTSKKTTITAKGGEEAYGIVMFGKGELTFGNTVDISAESGENGVAYALWVGDGGDLSDIKLVSHNRTDVRFLKDSETTLTGGVHFGRFAAVDLEGDLTVTGDFTTETDINAEGKGRGTLHLKEGFFDSTDRTVNLRSVRLGQANLRGGNLNATDLTVDGASTKTGGSISVETLTLGDNGKLSLSNTAFSTKADQIFTVGLKANGQADGDDTIALKYGKEKLVFDESTLTITDRKYGVDYLKSASTAFQDAFDDSVISFSGELIDKDGKAVRELPIGDVAQGQILEKVALKSAAAEGTHTVTVNQNVGGEALRVTKGSSVEIAEGTTLTLVGNAEGGELVDFKDAGKNAALDVKGTLALGSTTAATAGKLTSAVSLESGAGIEVRNGTFTLADVTTEGTTTLTTGRQGELKVGELKVGSDAVGIKGTVAVEKLSAAMDTGNLNVSEGSLSVASGSLKGVTVAVGDSGHTVFFSAREGKPETMTSQSARVFAYGAQTFDGSVAVGENAVLALGTDDLSGFHRIFDESLAEWTAESSAAYVAAPVTIAAGASLTVGKGKAQGGEGKVSFGSGAMLVADLTKLKAGETLLTAAEGVTFDVDQDSVAYLTGIVEDDATYKLTNEENADYWNDEETLRSGSYLLELTFHEEDGGWTVKNVAAQKAFGDLMQGHAIADAGYRAEGAQGDYVRTLLTDTTGLSDAAVAARFDAAMNPGGSLAVYTTAYDRASDLRLAVRAETAEAADTNRLWARVTGGKTKLDGISTGAQALDVETDAYGLVVGGDTQLNGWTIGAAFTAGSGETENASVAAKDEFDFYGLALYGKKTVGHHDFLFDASMTQLKSDLSVKGVADLEADADTTVWSLGGEVRRTAKLAWADVTPFVGANLYHVASDGYDTNHGVRVADADATAVEFPIGAELSKAFAASNGMTLKPAFTFAVVPTVGDTDIDQDVRFAGAESTYNHTFADDVKVRSNLSFEAESGNCYFGLKAGYEWGDEERGSTTFSLNAAYRF